MEFFFLFQTAYNLITKQTLFHTSYSCTHIIVVIVAAVNVVIVASAVNVVVVAVVNVVVVAADTDVNVNILVSCKFNAATIPWRRSISFVLRRYVWSILPGSLRWSVLS